MSAIDDFFASFDRYRDLSNETIAAYKKEIESLKNAIEFHKTYEIALKEMMCRIIEGEISEETQQRLLKKFRS